MQRDIRQTDLYREIEALYTRIRQPGSGQISDAAEAHVSPDGRLAAFTGTIVEGLEGTPPTRICCTDLITADTRVLTFGPNTDRLPKFSPSGKQIAFLSDRHRAGQTQLYLLDPVLGVVTATPHVQGWVEYLHWSPDGQQILLGVAGHGADLAGGQGAVSSQQLTRDSPTWMPSVETGDESYRWRRVWVYDVAANEVRQVGPADCNVWEAVWCGTKALAAVVSPGPSEGLWYTASLHILDIEAKSSRALHVPHSQLGWPAASPSGDWLAVVEGICSDRWIVSGELLLVDPSSGRAQRVDTQGVDVTCTEWRSEHTLLIAGHRGAETVVGTYDVASEVFAELWVSEDITGTGRYVAVSGFQDAGDCVLVGEGFGRAPEIAVIHQGVYRAVRSFDTGYARELDVLHSAELVRWRAPDDLTIEGWLLRPNDAAPHALVMNIHGGPVWHWRPQWLGRSGLGLTTLALLSKGYAVFLPNPRGSTGRGQEFVRPVLGDMGGADTHDFLAGLDHLVERGIADPQRLGVTGGSYGGFMSAWLITQDPRFAAAVVVTPHTNQVTEHLIGNIPQFVALFLADHYTNPNGKYYERSPILYAQRVKAPVLNIAGALDRCTPPEEAVQFHNALLENGAISTLVIYPEEGHGVRKLPALFDYTARVVQWFQTHMSVSYPQTRIDVAEETLAGVTFEDPYRWLEDDTPEVREWQRTQAELATRHVRQWPGFEQLREWVEHFSVGRDCSIPVCSAGLWFRTEVSGSGRAQLLVADEPLGAGRVLFETTSAAGQRPAFLSWFAPSPDGRTVAVGICPDGSEHNHIQLIDVASGALLPDPPAATLMDNWTGGVQWLPDSSGFFFTALSGPAERFAQAVYLHRRTPAVTTMELEIPWTERQEWRMVVPSRDGRHAVAIERLRNPVPVAVAELSGFPLRWRPFVTSIKGTVAGHVLTGRYVAITDVNAPRGRLVSIPLDADDPNDPRTWQELMGETDAVLRTLTPVGGALYLTEFVNTYTRLRVLDFAGNVVKEVPLPERSVLSEPPFPIMTLAPKGQPDRFIFLLSSLATSHAMLAHSPGREGLEVLRQPQVQLQDAIAEDRSAISRDGTRIPYHTLRLAHGARGTQQPRPTLIYAYGGFNFPLVPQFPGAMTAFVAAGGTFVHVHLRGGGEFGHDWWQAGRLRNKQNGYDDLYAVAEDLIAAGLATPELLAVTGGSNGGLMCGVALTQRPELWKVVVPRVPILDLIGACREAYGRMAVLMEFADVDDPDEVRRLATFSPYQQVRDDRTYPAVFLDAGATDPRCPPWHARKFAARLQRANGALAPVLLHVWENVGHGWATDKRTVMEQNTEWLAFTLRHLGVERLPPSAL